MAQLADTVPGWVMKNDFILYDWYQYYNCTTLKHHTIRVGDRWKSGDMASLRVWSDKPYRSKQVEFAQVEVKRIWEFCLHIVGDDVLWKIDGIGGGNFDTLSVGLKIIAENDGLAIRDFIDWFISQLKSKDRVFSGQIICWSDKVKY